MQWKNYFDFTGNLIIAMFIIHRRHYSITNEMRAKVSELESRLRSFREVFNVIFILSYQIYRKHQSNNENLHAIYIFLLSVRWKRGWCMRGLINNIIRLHKHFNCQFPECLFLALCTSSQEFADDTLIGFLRF